MIAEVRKFQGGEIVGWLAVTFGWAGLDWAYRLFTHPPPRQTTIFIIYWELFCVVRYTSF